MPIFLLQGKWIHSYCTTPYSMLLEFLWCEAEFGIRNILAHTKSSVYLSNNIYNLRKLDLEVLYELAQFLRSVRNIGCNGSLKLWADYLFAYGCHLASACRKRTDTGSIFLASNKFMYLQIGCFYHWRRTRIRPPLARPADEHFPPLFFSAQLLRACKDGSPFKRRRGCARRRRVDCPDSNTPPLRSTLRLEICE